MKRFLLSVPVVLLFSFVSAQNRFGIFVGPQMTTARYTVEGQKQKTDKKYGFQLGATMKVPFEGSLYFAPAAFYSMKGYKVAFTQFAYPPDQDAADNNTVLHTFELAALLQVDLGTKPGHFFIKGGPSLDFQLFGKEKYNLQGGGEVNRNMKFDYSAYGHFSANAIAILGYETIDGFSIFAQYSHGLASINNADFGPKIHHRVYGITIGKYFNNKKIVIDTRNRE